MATADDVLSDAKEAFSLAESTESDNRTEAEDDIRFARLAEQWPEAILKQRQTEGRPTLTINKLPAFIRQVVNDARQNKPSIKVHPSDSGADKETAEIFSGLIRNIEYASNADVAYDTATECAVTGGFGYFRIGLDYAHEDSFDLDISIQRVANPFSVYGDPHSTAADSSDWNSAFIVDVTAKEVYKRAYPNASLTNWGSADWTKMSSPWLDGEMVMTAEYWTREEYEKEILLLITGEIIPVEALETPPYAEIKAAIGAAPQLVAKARKAKCYRVKQTILNGAEVLAENNWPGQFIPIVPVYGDEVNVKGKRYFRSLIRDAKDAQRMFNYWRSNATELVALAPRVPFIGPKGAFVTDADRWATANTQSYPYLEYDGQVPPQRQPLDTGAAAGSLQEALNASDDIKTVTGLYDASLGARSNETSGRAIMARQREGDVSTFHFQDNMARAIRHAGRILIDLIPKVYTKDRIVRVIGEDGKPTTTPLGKPVPVPGPDGQPQMQPNPEDPQGAPVPMLKVFDLAAGKYDLTVTTGPSFTSRREEAAFQMTEMIRAFPMAAAVIGPELAKNLDWPGADKIAEKLEAMSPKPGGGIPPEVQQMVEHGKELIGKLTEENQKLKTDHAADMAKVQSDHQLAQAKLAGDMQIEMQRVENDRQLGLTKAANEAEIAAMKARTAAETAANRPAPPRAA